MPQTTWPALWYTSRTPTEIGQSHCAFARWLEFHAGRHGTGYRRTSLSVPLATGSAAHVGQQLLGEWILDFQTSHQQRPPSPDAIGEVEFKKVIAWAASEAARRYEVKARAKGFVEMDAASRHAVETLILEQRTVVEGCCWAWATIRLPELLAEYRILDVEREEAMIFACTCGLGEVGDITAHATRGCQGIVQQGRADWLVERLDGNGLAYIEFKTKAQPQAFWETAWSHSGQLFVNMETASRRLGKSVGNAFIEILFKGWRGRDKDAPPDAPKWQHGLLAYGYYQPANPPMREAAWAAQYRFTDEQGKGHTLPRTYERQPIWDEALPLLACREGASRVESWIASYIQMDQWPQLVRVLGPFPRPMRTVPKAIRGIIAEEERWRQDVEFLREHAVFDPGDVGTEGVTADQIIPRSWHCTHYDNTPCAFAPICNEDPGWEHPLESGRYAIRTPHHAPEQAAFEACGVTFPEEEGEENDDDGA